MCRAARSRACSPSSSSVVDHSGDWLPSAAALPTPARRIVDAIVEFTANEQPQPRCLTMRSDGGLIPRHLPAAPDPGPPEAAVITCGVAAAFNAPIGGILFSLEEVSSFWDPQLTLNSFVCASLGTFTMSAWRQVYALLNPGHAEEEGTIVWRTAEAQTENYT